MAKPSYSMDNVTFTELPGAYRFGGKPRSKEEGNIKHVSDSGIEYKYRLYKKKTIEITFRVSDTQLDEHETFDEATDGELNNFYLSVSGAGSSDSVFVSREGNFDPVELDGPGGNEAMYDITYLFKEALE